MTNELTKALNTLANLKTSPPAQSAIKVVVKDWIARCAVMFPDYGTMDEAMIRGKIREFSETFSDINATESEIHEAFRQYRQRQKSFPVPADIVEIIKGNRPEPRRRDEYFRYEPGRVEDCATADDWAGLIAGLKEFGR